MLSNRDYKRLHFLIQIAFIAVFIFLAYLAVRYVFGAVAPFIIAIVAASLAEPLVRLLTGKLRFPRPLASAISVVLLLIIVIAASIFLSTTIWAEGKALLSSLPKYIIGLFTSVKDMVNNSSGVFSYIPDDLLNEAVEYATNYDYSSLLTGSLGSLLVGYAGSVVSYIPNIIVFFIVTVVSSIFMSSAFPIIKKFVLAQFSPANQELLIYIKHNLFSTLWKYIRSYSLLMLITFTELLIFFLIFGFKPALSLAFFISLIDILPVLGVGTVLIPWAAFSLLSGDPWRALIIISMYIVVTIVRQILEPKIIGDHVGMLPIVTLFCIWVGLKLFGFGGMFLVPVTVVILKNLQKDGKIKIWKNITKENEG